MEYEEETDITGEMYGRGESAMERAPEEVRRHMRQARRQAAGVAEEARERVGAAREQLAEMGERVEPGTMIVAGLAAVFAIAAIGSMLYYSRYMDRVEAFLRHRYDEYMHNIRSMTR